MRAAVDSFESHSDGYISQDFLENDVEEGLDEVEKKTIEITADANGIIESVQDIVDVEKIDETEVVETVHRGKRRVKEIVEELHDLDRSQVASLDSVKEDLQTMKSFLADMESKFKSGELSVGNYSMKAIRDIDAYQSIKESVDGEDGLIDDSLELILKKMENGETLTDVEQDELYDYTQNIMLDDKKRKEIEDIASFMSEEDIGKLTERLNEKVVVSANALEEEIAMIQSYVFTGDKRPGELVVERDIKAKLETYLIVLKNYQSAFGKWDKTVAQVDVLKYEKDPDGVSGHYIETRLQKAPYRSIDRGNMSVKEYRDYALRDNGLDSPPLTYFNTTEVTYYTKANASSTYDHLENQKLLNEDANYTKDFIVMQIFNVIIGQMGKPVGVVQTALEHDIGKSELETEITIREAREVADMLSMEFSISENGSVPLSSAPETTVQLYPTEASYKILDRWQEVYDINSNIPYEENYIKSLDWVKINEYLNDNDSKIGGDLSDYITEGVLSGGQTVEDLAKGNT